MRALRPVDNRAMSHMPAEHEPGQYSSQEEDVLKQAKASGPSLVVLLVIAAVLLVGYLIYLAIANRGEAIARIRHYPDRYDGKMVTVSGRAGESFSVGSSVSYYLLQGRDSLVVFSRHGAPRKNQGVRVTGSISVGYLDGRPRPALFEGN
jgi:hypothetical protein